MKLLVTGARGQLGRQLLARGTARGHEVTALGHDALDISDHDSIERALHAPVDAVINAAAYTAVDRAQTDRASAYRVNRDGAGLLARACAARGIRMLHVSTDYVFDGAGTRPYREDDRPAPRQVYGDSKVEGENAVHECGGIVVRTSWLFGEGGPSFVHTMLRLALERPVLRVVADQHGCPTYAGDLADALLDLAPLPELAGTYHVCGSPPTTWHAFATAIVEEARRHREVACTQIEAITTAEYPTPAARPMYSVLDTSRVRALGIAMRPWSVGLARVVADALGAAADAR